MKSFEDLVELLEEPTNEITEIAVSAEWEEL